MKNCMGRGQIYKQINIYIERHYDSMKESADSLTNSLGILVLRVFVGNWAFPESIL